MKTWHVALMSVTAGLLLGLGATAVRLAVARSDVDRFGLLTTKADIKRPELPAVDGPQPKVVVEDDYDFGTMLHEAEGRHTFVFTNAGDFPLELTKGATTCKCTMSQLTKGVIPPGESAEVVLEWTTRARGDRFRQSATIWTNDRERQVVQLTIAGRLMREVEVRPEALTLNDLRIGKPKTAEVQLLSFSDTPLEVLAHDWLGAELSKHCDVVSEPMAPEELVERKAKSGVRVSVTVKPGLAAGLYDELLTLNTNAAKESTYKIPIHARVTGPITVSGPSWDSERWVLEMGTVTSDEGARRQLNMFVRGENAAETKVRVKSTRPDWLQVTLGEGKAISGGRVLMLPVTIEVPKGRPNVNYLGGDGATAEILIETDHPEAPLLRIAVEFAVAE